MITRSVPPVQANQINIYQKSTPPSLPSWQSILSQAVTDPKELLALLNLDPSLLPAAIAGAETFSMRVPHTYIARMQPGNEHDPLLLQILPTQAECEETEGFVHDPLGEGPKNPQPGIIHKYHGRLLLMPGQLCAVNCRFCFRRHFPYKDNRLNKDEWQAALTYIRDDTSIKEVIFSGGDPLAQNDKRLASLVNALADIPHVERVRIHTRMPVVIPQRVCDELLEWLTGTRLQTVMVIHCNHPNEIDGDVAQAMKTLHRHGIHLLNQSTILKGINDNVETLLELSEKLFACHVMPYYLHLFDKVQNAAHFAVDDDTVTKLVAQMSTRCSGYLVPKIVREVAGMSSKMTIAPTYIK